MKGAIGDIEKRRGRPATNAKPVLVRLAPVDLTALDEWITAQAVPLSRPEAVRLLLRQALKG